MSLPVWKSLFFTESDYTGEKYHLRFKNVDLWPEVTSHRKNITSSQENCNFWPEVTSNGENVTSGLKTFVFRRKAHHTGNVPVSVSKTFFLLENMHFRYDVSMGERSWFSNRKWHIPTYPRTTRPSSSVPPSPKAVSIFKNLICLNSQTRVHKMKLFIFKKLKSLTPSC